MDKTIIEETMRTYFKNEINTLKKLSKDSPYWFDLEESKTKSLDRAYGIQEFAQLLGVGFSVIDKEYSKFRDEINNM